MYVADYGAGDNSIAPESRTDFYSRIANELIIRRRYRQTGKIPAYTKLKEQRERILGSLAYEHLLNSKQPANSLKWGDAIRIVQETMSCSESEAASEFLELAKETGLVVEERTADSFRFIHLTFCEYLAAFEATQGRDGGWNKLVKCHARFFNAADQPHLKGRLVEVIPFASGLIPRVGRAAAITEISQIGDAELLARCFLETKAYDHELWPEFTRKQEALFVRTPESERDSAWLKRLHLFNVIINDAVNCAKYTNNKVSEISVPELFEKLIAEQPDGIASILSAFAKQDAVAAFRLAESGGLKLAEQFPEIAISSCDQPPFLALTIEKCTACTEGATWIACLAEAATRSASIGIKLHELAPPNFLESYVRDIPSSKHWYSHLFSARENQVGRLITAALFGRFRSPLRPEHVNLIKLQASRPYGDIRNILVTLREILSIHLFGKL